jgi:YidC/Oxa1 family membrane protein insertase
MPYVFANVLQPLIDATEAVMVWIHDNVVDSWGLSIIGLTIVVRLVLLPLTLRQFKSMQGLQRLQPEIKKLQAKYKDDKQRLNQEMMKFYQENKVNPLGSCLPLLAQMPIFIALFYMLRTDLKHDICPGIVGYAAETDKSVTSLTCSQYSEAIGGPSRGDWSFAFIPDLTAKATGGVLITLILLYIGSQLLSSVLMTVSADKNQRRLLIALPFIFVPFIISFPAGLILYWITTNLWTILQQYIVRKTVGPLRPPEVAPAGAAAAVAKSGSGSKSDDGQAGDGKPKAEKPEKPKRATPPPPPPRRKKKARSGRRR